MNYFPKYDGNIHPDEWINDIIKYYNMWEGSYGGFLITVKSLINPNIILPTEINDLVKLRDALKKDITFTTFKNLNKRKLQSLEYKSERDGGDTLKFLTDFRNLCYNSEINDIEEQKKYFIKALKHKISKYCLGICHQIVIHQNHQSQYQNQYQYHKSPSSNHTEVNCNNGSETIWKICYDSGLENYEGYLKSNDIVNLSIIKKRYGTQDGQWCVELIKQA
uniref:MIR domain-containing protein n=1 Tax=Rhizophagus irregularis (strain DAOM 181602 / DAOM 197198 / MUCL 43194) TaxID=747089 RepID=U9TTF6_RHIID